jgi:hypothetical protein
MPKPSLIASLLSKPEKGKDDSEPSMMDPGEEEGGDEASQLSSSILDAVKSDDASALYDALCALIDHHMDKEGGEGPEPSLDESSPLGSKY